ncbi:MAG: hypothetical protein AAF788_02365 [Pseudomonadota bacterium]
MTDERDKHDTEANGEAPEPDKINDPEPEPGDQHPTRDPALDVLKERVEASGMARLAMAAGAVALVGVAAVLLFGRDDGAVTSQGEGPPDYPPAEVESTVKAGTPNATVGGRLAVTFCHPDLFTTATGCTDDVSIMDPASSAVLAPGVWPSRAVTFVHPTDLEAPPREVSTCATFIPLARSGWGGLTTRDMQRAAQLSRACGVAALASIAKPAPGVARMTAADWKRLDRASIPGIGESSFAADDPIIASDKPHVWNMSNIALSAQFVDLAAADIDGDDVPEHIIEWTVLANGGTAFARGFASLPVTSEPTRLQKIDPFAE